jgi:IgA Peptidase M64
MSTKHGTVLGTTKLVDSGEDILRYTIALMPEGYTAPEMTTWEADAQSFVDYLLGQVPFSDPDLRCAINVYRIDVASDESGADNPKCGGTTRGTKVKTYFDATFCAAEDVRRTMSFDTDTALQLLQAEVPFWRMGLVIVNSSVDGGSGGTIPILSTARADWQAAAVHELGHSAFGLADEYETYAGCDSGEEGHDVHLGLEPIEPNVTVFFGAQPSLPLLKWAPLVTPAGTAIPTSRNPDPDCTACDPTTTSPVADGTVGAFEGAHYFHCGAYRPEFDCRMRNASQPFCAVCANAVRTALAPFANPAKVTPLTTAVTFADTEAGTTVPASAAFTVESCRDMSFFVTDGPRRLDGGPEEIDGTPVLDLPLGSSFTSPALPGGAARTAHLWITYRATDPGDLLLGVITIESLETGESFTFLITGNTVAAVNVGVLLCLDQSASMIEDATGGGSKGEALQQAAEVFVDVIHPEEGIGVLTFDTDASGGSITDAGEGLFGAGRVYARDDIAAYAPNPSGLTSIGDAVERADSVLQGAASRYDEMAMLVFTDGMETAPKYLSEVSGLISANSQTFAVGLGTAENLDPAALHTLCNGSGGELLLTGNDPSDTFFLLAKYFLNILAGATNTEIVYDPEGFLAPNAGTLRVPFSLNETDTSADAILITPVPSAVRFALETPAGDVITPMTPVPGTSYIKGASNAYFRVSLPALVDGRPVRDGTWHALIGLDMDAWTAGDNFPELFQYLQSHPSALANGLPYSLHFQARSNLRLVAQCLQDSYEPGAELRVRAVLTEYSLPVDGRATVRAELTRPDGTAATLPMPEIEPGVFEAVEPAHQAGVYRFHVLAAGDTLRDYPFTREQLVTGFTYHGGDTPSTHDDGDDDWCKVLECLIGALSPEACERLCIDRDKMRRCLSKHCRGKGITTATAPADIDPSDIPGQLQSARYGR